MKIGDYLCTMRLLPVHLPFLLALYLFPCGPAPLLGQELRTNEQGEMMIVYPDGSARYFNDLTLIEEQRNDSVGTAYPVVSVKIEPLRGGGENPTEADLRKIATRKMQLALEAAELAGKQADAAVKNRVKLEQELAVARGTGRDAEANNLLRRLELARTTEATAVAERKTAEQRFVAANRVLIEERYVKDYNEARRRDRDGPAVDRDLLPERRLRMLLPARPAYTGFGPLRRRDDITETPPCSDAFRGDITPGDPRNIPTLFFTHTDETLRPYLDGKEYLRATAWVSRDERNERYLVLRLNFANPNAMTNYGFLPERSTLSLHLLNGRVINLQAVQQAVGIIDRQKFEVNYEVAYRLPRAYATDLRNEPLDFVRLFWSSGFEEYEVYQVDALARIMSCL